jgi:hypothetical protein
MSRFTTTALTRALSALRACDSKQGASAPHWGWTLLISRSDVCKGTTIRPTRALSALRVWLLLPLLFTACAGYSPAALKVGDSESSIVAQMGAPTARHTLPNGQQRLEYARGPYGKHTYMLTLDATGRLLGVEQVLTEQRFANIQPGMPVAQVRTELGRPAQARVGWRGVGEVWSYRYDATFCQWFQVWLVDAVVREAAYAPDPLCDVDHDDKHSRRR